MASQKAVRSTPNRKLVDTPLPFPTRHDLSARTRSKAAVALNQTLAEIFDLQSQIKQAHWNVKGTSFFGLHKLFDEIAGKLTEPMDSVAERILSIGGFAQGTVRMAGSASTLPELPAEFRQEDVVGDLADRVAQAAKGVRARIDRIEKAGDKVTSDLLIDVAAALDKALYFLEAYQFHGRA